MRPSTSLFARKLKSWRASQGLHGRMTQEDLAELLGVSVDAVSKYERSVSFIRGDLEHRLSERLEWNRSDIIACREDWEARGHSDTGKKYRILDQQVLDEVFEGSWKKAVAAEHDISSQLFDGLPDELAADAEVFGPIYSRHPDQWGAVLHEDKIVASWVVLILFPEHEEAFRAGRLIETDLTINSIRQPILPGTYFDYSTSVVVLPGHEAASPLLLTSFVRFLEDLAGRGIFFHAIGTTAVSRGGNQLCGDLGMTRLGSHMVSNDYGIWELTGRALSTSLFARKSPVIKRAYTDAFGASQSDTGTTI